MKAQGSVPQIGHRKWLYFSVDDRGGIAYGDVLITRLMTYYSGFEFSVQKRWSVFDDGAWRTQHELRRQSDHSGFKAWELRRLIADAGVLVRKPITSFAIDLGSSDPVAFFGSSSR